MRALRRGIGSGPLLLLLALCGCPGKATVSPSDGAGESVVPDSLGRELPTVYACNTVDILFVIDNSNTMVEEQENLAQNFPKLIARVEAITPPIKSYHVGVISTDIGAGPFVTGTCEPKGDDGVLQHAPRGSGCAPSYPLYLSGPGLQVAQDFACIAKLGTDGCGYEQQLESALRALSTQPANDGFVRPSAPLAIVFITDEDDCSAQDTALFDESNAALGPLPTRCVRLT